MTGQKTNGRKQHLLVDTLGFLLRIKVHTASIGEREGGKLLLSELQKAHPKIELIWADMGYRGTAVPNLPTGSKQTQVQRLRLSNVREDASE